jgi:hypothetical protein
MYRKTRRPRHCQRCDIKPACGRKIIQSSGGRFCEYCAVIVMNSIDKKLKELEEE